MDREPRCPMCGLEIDIDTCYCYNCGEFVEPEYDDDED